MSESSAMPMAPDKVAFEDILANLPEALLVIDRDWRVVYANQQAAQFYKQAPRELPGRSLWERLPASARTSIEPQLRCVMEQRVPAHFEYLDDGRLIWIEVRSFPCEAGIAVYCRDITDRKDAEAEILSRDKELQDFIDNAAIGIHWVGEDGTILWANHAELKLLGYEREEYVGHNIMEFHVDTPVIVDILQRLKSDQELLDYEARLRCRNGSIRHVSITSNAYRQHGRFVHTRCFTSDITTRHRAEELQQRLAAIIESSDVAIIGKDLGGIIRSWNGSAERMFGYTAEEAIGKPVSMLAVPDRADEVPNILERITRGERVDPYETKRLTRDGRVIDISLTVSPIRNAAGVIVGASKVVRDITGQTRATELQERLAAIVESSDDGIISKDLNGIIRSWNRGAERIFGYTAEEAIGKPVSMLAVPERVDEIPNIIERIARGERVDHYQTKRQTKDGRRLTVSLTVSPVRDASGTIVGASKIVRDITERERNEWALRAANEALSRSNADLEQFAYSAYHDLQEPLRMVSIYSEMLQRKFSEKLGAVGDEYIRYTVAGALRMERLIKDLVRYTQASTLAEEPTDDADTNLAVERAIANLEREITETGAYIAYAPLPPVRMHQFQADQIFHNLLENAIRYRSAEPPQVHIMAERQGSQWQFSVQDNGIGADPKYKEQIFGIFKRLHSAAEYPGTGMGLAICQRIVERAGGRIWVESEPGDGSTFFFTLPVGHLPCVNAEPEAANSPGGRQSSRRGPGPRSS